MSFNGGDLQEITVKDPNLGSFTFQPKAAEDFEIDLGGFTTADEANGVTGSGAAIFVKNRKRWKVSGPIAWDMIDTDELKNLQDLSNSVTQKDFLFTHINGTIWGAKGDVVGDLVGNSNSAQISVNFSGGGRITQL